MLQNFCKRNIDPVADGDKISEGAHSVRTSCANIGTGKGGKLCCFINKIHFAKRLVQRKADGRTCRADVFERCRRRKSRCGAKFSDELPPVECVKKVDIARPAVQNGNRQFAVN